MRNPRLNQRYYNYASPEQVKNEIEEMEKRLNQIGRDGGDCAYEKAMVRYFEDQVEQRHEWLTNQTH